MSILAVRGGSISDSVSAANALIACTAKGRGRVTDTRDITLSSSYQRLASHETMLL